MNLDELSQMSVEELRRTANERLGALDGAGMLDRGPILSEAQFYIDEIERRSAESERRKQSRVGVRDLILELVVIILIGLELYFGIVGGNKQLAVLQTLKTSADQQLGVLQNLNTSAGETAKIMRSLREEQDIVLATQQQTLQLTAQMNGALQTQLGLNFAPALTLVYDESKKLLNLQNYGKTNLFLWGVKENGVTEMFPQPRIVAPTTEFSFPADSILTRESPRVPKGNAEAFPLDVYLKTANGKKYLATYSVIAIWKNDALTLNVQHIGMKQENW